MRTLFYAFAALTFVAGTLSACGSAAPQPPQLTVIAPYTFQVTHMTDKRTADEKAANLAAKQEAHSFESVVLARALEKALNADIYAQEPAYIKLTLMEYTAVKTEHMLDLAMVFDAEVTRGKEMLMVKENLSCHEEGKNSYTLMASLKEVSTGDKKQGGEYRAWQTLVERCAQRMADRIAQDVASWHRMKLNEMGRR